MVSSPICLIYVCHAFTHSIPLELQAKLSPKSREVLFMGYPPGVKGYQVHNIATGQFFNENLSLPHLTGEAPAPVSMPLDASGEVSDDDSDDGALPVPSPGANDSLISHPPAPEAPSPPAAVAPSSSSPTQLGTLCHSAQSWVLTEAPLLSFSPSPGYGWSSFSQKPTKARIRHTLIASRNHKQCPRNHLCRQIPLF